jgi:hypothetical protein
MDGRKHTVASDFVDSERTNCGFEVSLARLDSIAGNGKSPGWILESMELLMEPLCRCEELVLGGDRDRGDKLEGECSFPESPEETNDSRKRV